MDWNDLRFFLAVAQHGSIRAAAQVLGVNQSTVNRRMDVLEHDLDLALFDRSTRGLTMTEQGRAIAEAAGPMQVQADRVLVEAGQLQRKLAGTLKIAGPQAIFTPLVAPVLAEFHRLHPEVHLICDDSERVLDLMAGEADIAFRAGHKEPDDHFWFRKATAQPWAVFCSRDYAARHGMPKTIAEVAQHSVVALGGRIGQGPANQWFMAVVPRHRVTGEAEGVPGLQKTLNAGLGVGILPCVTGASEPALVQCFDAIPELAASVWLVTTHEMSRDPKVRAFIAVAMNLLRSD